MSAVVSQPSRLEQHALERWGRQGPLALDEDAAHGFGPRRPRVAAPSQSQYFSGLTWRRLLDRGVLDVTLGRTYTRFTTIQNDSLDPPNTIFRAYSTEGETSLRADLTVQATPTVELSGGAVAKYASALDYDLLLPGALRLDAGGVPRPLALGSSQSGGKVFPKVVLSSMSSPSRFSPDPDGLRQGPI